MTTVAPVWPIAGAPTTGQQPTTNVIELCNYYVERLIYQYGTLPNASRLIALMTKQAIADDIFNLIQLAYNLDTAVGPQLDVIGKYVGVARNINPVSPSPYLFEMAYYNGTSTNGVGMRLYAGTVNLNGVWLTYASGLAPKTNLTDIQYRLVIQLQIILNYSDNTLASIQYYLDQLLPGFVTITDNQNMTLTYLVAANSPLGSQLLQQFLPKPMGVGITVNLISSGSTRVLSDGSTNRITSTNATRVTSAGT